MIAAAGCVRQRCRSARQRSAIALRIRPAPPEPRYGQRRGSRATTAGSGCLERLAGAKPLRPGDLHGASLVEFNLKGANLRETRLVWADLRGANLEGADLRKGRLSWANLEGADLRRADLRKTRLAWANIFEAHLEGAHLEGAHLDAVNLKRPIETFEAPPGLGWGPPDVESVHFTVHHSKEIGPEVWRTLLAYVHILEMRSTVEADAKQRLKAPYGRRIAAATHNILRGAEIVVTPELPGCRFNPTSARLLWLEDWHRVEFRLQARSDLAGFELGKAVNGRVAFYVESVLVGEVPIWTCILDEADIAAADAPASTASAEPYEAIFVSYAHEDSAVVNRLGRAYKVLGALLH